MHYHPMERKGVRETLVEEIRGCETTDERATVLRQYGYKATVVETDGGRMKEEDVETLASTFAFTPQPLKPGDFED